MVSADIPLHTLAARAANLYTADLQAMNQDITPGQAMTAHGYTRPAGRRRGTDVFWSDFRDAYAAQWLAKHYEGEGR
jgi:hypothetical protein